MFTSHNEEDIHHLKSLFGLEELEDNRDFAATIAFPLGGPLSYPGGTWQELNWKPDYGSDDIWNFCSNITNAEAPENIASIDYDLAKYTNGDPWIGLGNYANYVKKFLVPTCDGVSIKACFGTQDETVWADTSNQGGRSYLYTLCVEGGGYQAAPLDGPTVLSRIVQADYTQVPPQSCHPYQLKYANQMAAMVHVVVSRRKTQPYPFSTGYTPVEQVRRSKCRC